ncbi:UNVERIFIED_ORG: putative ubiquitin-RnfH superfamily antitoxin RatB of RatAB toxin-antitoxin module [Peribacillus simplex]
MFADAVRIEIRVNSVAVNEEVERTVVERIPNLLNVFSETITDILLLNAGDRVEIYVEIFGFAGHINPNCTFSPARLPSFPS